MGLLALNYRRPAHVPQRASIISSTSHDSSRKSDQIGRAPGVPDALTFDKIMEGGTCPPCTLRDFMNYLVYIEHSAENLQFFLWYRDYTKRFHNATTPDLALAPEWNQAMEEESITRIQKEAAEKAHKSGQTITSAFKGTDFEKTLEGVITDEPSRASTSERTPSEFSGSQATTYRSQAADAFATAGLKQPFTVQPYRNEIDRVIATYIAEDSPRQLNISAREQKAVLTALAYTTHPSAFRGLARAIENTLRRQAHPNFIRWSICNGNPARVFFARGLGVGTIMLATIAAIIVTLSSANRGYRAIPAIGWVIGIATLVAAYKGMCVVLHGMHHRHVRPWELFEEVKDDEANLSKGSFDSFGSANSYEDEPWVTKYEQRNVVRKVFDREVWIQEPMLRQIQDTIFVQSMLSALFGAGVLTAIFVAVPGGNFI